MNKKILFVFLLPHLFVFGKGVSQETSSSELVVQKGQRFVEKVEKMIDALHYVQTNDVATLAQIYGFYGTQVLLARLKIKLLSLFLG